MLEKEIDLRRHYATKFRFILIDEFQDTSTLQMDWLKLMIDRDDQTQAVRNCFMAVVSPAIDREIQLIWPFPREMMIKVFMLFVVHNV